MSFTSSKPILKAAFREGFAVGAFNFCTAELFQAISNAAREKNSPVIFSTSEGEASHIGFGNAVSIVKGFASAFPKPCSLHLDHGKSIEVVERALRAGYPSVHFDGSKLKFEKNVRLTRKAVSLAKKFRASVEGELGAIPGSSSLHKNVSISSVSREEFFTEPKQAGEFAKRTGVDALAVSIGNAHGVWKGSPKLDFERLKEIRDETSLPLVLHGGSGIAAKSIKKAVRCGVCKVNVNTELRAAFTVSLRKALERNKSEIVPYHFLSETIPAVQSVVGKKIALLGCAGKM